MTEKEQAIRDALQTIMKARMGTGGGSIPGGDVDLPIDPDLLQPASDSDPFDASNIEIDDPDNLLKAKANQGGDQGDEQNQGQGGDQGDEQNQGQGGDQGDKQNQGQGGDQGNDIHNDHKFSAEFATAWNEIVDRYDNDEISDAQLRTLMRQIQLGNITEL